VVNLIKYPPVPGRFKFFECSTPKCTVTFWLCRLVSYTCRQTHSQNGAWQNDESRDRGSNRVTEKTTLVVARLQSVNISVCTYIIVCTYILGARRSAVGWGNALRFRFPMSSLELSISLNFQLRYGLGVDWASNRNQYQEYFTGVKAAGV
jgi:hypothetical protein